MVRLRLYYGLEVVPLIPTPLVYEAQDTHIAHQLHKKTKDHLCSHRASSNFAPDHHGTTLGELQCCFDLLVSGLHVQSF